MPDQNGIEHELRRVYPRPSAAATERARAAVTAAESRRAIRRPRRFGRIVVVPVALAVLAAFPIGVAVGATTLGSSRSNTASVLSFTPVAGWNTIQTTAPYTPPNHQQLAWAANVPIDSRDSVDGQPIHTVRGLPPDGVVIWAAAVPVVYDPGYYAESGLPVQLTPGRLLSGQYENSPGPNIAQIGPINMHVRGQYLTVIAWFGTPMPSAQLREEAQIELDNLQVPAG